MSTCKNGHPLVAAFSGAAQYNCDICNSGLRPDDFHFACRACNFDVCPNCLPAGDNVEGVTRSMGRVYVAPTVTHHGAPVGGAKPVPSTPANFAYAPPSAEGGDTFVAPHLHHVERPNVPSYDQPEAAPAPAPAPSAYHHSFNRPQGEFSGVPAVASGGLGLVKPGKLNLEDTNVVALIGSDMDKKLRLEASNKEQAWERAGKAPGLEIWRIENFKVIAWPRERYGSFYDGDSYIVLSTYKTGDSPALKYDLHFWLGKATTQDEAGTAAYKTVELDDHLGCTPVEHRQVQGNEDDLFLSYFKPGMTILAGGVASGFHHYKAPDYPKTLLCVEGQNAKGIRVTQVPLSANSLHAGAVFILDLGMELIQFNGNESSPFERQQAGEACRKIVSDRNGHPSYSTVEQGDSEADRFLQLCGGSPGQSIKPAPPKPAASRDIDTKIFRFDDLSLLASGLEANRRMLQSDQAYVIDLGREVYVWVGRKASAGPHKNALQKAIDYLRKYNRPFTMPIHRVIEGHENQTFISTF